MKKIGVIIVFSFFLLLASCNNSVVPKPDKLIDQDEMVDILYDLSVMDAVRNQSYALGTANTTIGPNEYIYKKYAIDSVQFAQNNKYYAANVSKYKRMYNKVNERLTENADKISQLMQKNNEKQPPASSGTNPQIK